jgi:hypothetical protein
MVFGISFGSKILSEDLNIGIAAALQIPGNLESPTFELGPYSNIYSTTPASKSGAAGIIEVVTVERSPSPKSGLAFESEIPKQ